MTIYKNKAPSTTSLSDDNEDDNTTKPFSLTSLVKDLPSTRTSWFRPSSQSPHITSSYSPMSQLPPEVLIHILKHVHSTSDLHSALLVSRIWCQCAAELLWQKPSFPNSSVLTNLVKLLSSDNLTFAYAHFIRRLNFLNLGNDLNDTVLTTFRKCDRLERLTLINCDSLSSGTLAHIFPCFPNLVAIDLNGVISTTDDAVVGLAKSARRLQGINLSGCTSVTDIGITALAENCAFLRRVKLSGLLALTDAPVTALTVSCPLLLEIDLNNCQGITDLAVRSIWEHAHNMREIKLAHCSALTTAAFPTPLRLSGNTRSEGPNPFSGNNTATALSTSDLQPLHINRIFEQLRILDLTACNLIADEAIEGIISHAPKIRVLILSKCTALTDRSVETICKLGKYLHDLHLGHVSQISDRTVRTLSRSCVRLRYVDFANCHGLTDLAVFELATLPKLHRIGLVRVNNITDEAIYALADRHATLERVHLSYCDQISVPAIHFLLQKLHKLTHLSLTGVSSFQQWDLQQFCREPPREYNPAQQQQFCVYSGRNVVDLRAYLTELYDRMNDMNATDDTEYEDDSDGNVYPMEGTPEAESQVPNGNPFRDPSTQRTPRVPVPLAPPTTQTLSDTPTIIAGPSHHAQPQHPLDNASSQRQRAPTHVLRTDALPIIENPHSPTSDIISDRSNQSNGADFFRTYQGPNIATTNNGAMTPDLLFAEIGHGRGVVNSIRSQPPQSNYASDSIPHSDLSNNVPDETPAPLSTTNGQGPGIDLPMPIVSTHAGVNLYTYLANLSRTSGQSPNWSFQGVGPREWPQLLPAIRSDTDARGTAHTHTRGRDGDDGGQF